MRPITRKRLDHTTHFAGRFGATYFITVCCQRRGSNQLCHDEIAAVLAKTARTYHEWSRWNLNLLVLMPDHLHALVAIDGRTSLAHLIRDFKRITTKMTGVKWQRNFFDHRLRHDESLTEQFAFICGNPVRAGWFAPKMIGPTSSGKISNLAGRGGSPEPPLPNTTGARWRPGAHY